MTRCQRLGPDRTLSFIEVYEEDGKGEQFLESMSETTSKTKGRLAGRNLNLEFSIMWRSGHKDQGGAYTHST